jgi:hypothetical protein
MRSARAGVKRSAPSNKKAPRSAGLFYLKEGQA